MDKPATHIAIFVGDAIEKILSGRKTVEGRFSRGKIAPYGQIKKGDIILLKQSGGKIIGQAEADNALYFDQLNGERLSRLRREYQAVMGMEDAFWEAKRTAQVASLIFLKNPRRYLSALAFHKSDRRPWVVLN